MTCKVDKDDIKEKDIGENDDGSKIEEQKDKDEKSRSFECSNQNYIIGNNIT